MSNCPSRKEELRYSVLNFGCLFFEPTLEFNICKNREMNTFDDDDDDDDEDGCNR